MRKIFCDLCGAEMPNIEFRDSTTQYYTVIKNGYDETDICNDCMNKIINAIRQN